MNPSFENVADKIPGKKLNFWLVVTENFLRYKRPPASPERSDLNLAGMVSGWQLPALQAALVPGRIRY